MSVGFALMKKRLPWLLAGLLCLALVAPRVHAAESDDIDRAEVLGWTDPDAALELLERVEPSVQTDAQLTELLTVRGMAYADKHQDVQAKRVIERLDSMGGRGLASATRASRIVRAHLMCLSDDFDGAREEIKDISATETDTPVEKFRLEMVRGRALHFLGERESATRSYESALDIAREMRSPRRELRALQRLTGLYASMGNLDRAERYLNMSRGLAAGGTDLAALAMIDIQESDIADHRGDRETQKRATLAALDYARQSHSKPLVLFALGYAAHMSLQTHDYRGSLRYSEEGLALSRAVRHAGMEQTILFNMGIARIGLGEIREGKQLAESAIALAVKNDSPTDAYDSLREYGEALEGIGDFKSALEVFHRADRMGGELMNTERQRALLDLTAKYDDERKTREIELLKRDNALKGANLREQQLRQIMTMMIAGAVVALAFGLGWAFNRVRKANDRLRHASEHDTLTRVHNRRYFNDKVLARHVDRRFQGCVLLIDLDHFKRINDLFGHPGGDAVLQAVAQRLSDSLRDCDTLVRWGGEEFLAVLPPMTRDQLTTAVRRLLAVVQDKPILWRSQVIPCTISIGYSVFPVEPDVEVSLDRAIALVDKALYEAKKRGRNRACMITSIRAGASGDLTSINAAFDVAVSDNVVQMKELENARA